jgi:hypothetical protein
MKRRQFLQTSLAASVLAALPALAAGSRPPGPQEYYELRAYRLKPGATADSLHAYLEQAYLPALKRAGIGPVGVFVEAKPQENTAVFLLAPYKSLDQVVEVGRRVETDKEYRAAAKTYLETPPKSAAFERIDSWFLLAFVGMPRMEIPAFCKNRGPDRVFELRTYEGPTEAKAQKKVDMFNDGEIDVMREVNLSPIFYGQAISGPNLPHLTYMTSGENETLHQQHWAAFSKHPVWERMKNDPQYKDTVSKSTKWILKPTAYSQV